MESTTFDQWTRRVTSAPRSRRGLLRLGLGGGLGLLVFGQGADDALACVKTGKDCKKGKPNGDCCSGTCRRGTCRRTPGAKGCQLNSRNWCTVRPETCPNNRNGYCMRLDNGKPFCFEIQRCQFCTSNADCTVYPNGKCVTNCPYCEIDNNQGCFYPRF